MLEKVRTIRLYGVLGAQFGRVHRFAVASPAQAIAAMCAMLPGFERCLMESKDNGIAFSVFVGKKNIEESMLTAPTGDDDIRIAPIIIGSKQSGLFQIVVGVVLLVVGFLTWGSTWAPAIAMMGGALVLSGAMAMLSPQAKVQSAEDRDGSKASYNFNGAVNTQAQGNPVPVPYGELIVGSAVGSAGIFSEDQV